MEKDATRTATRIPAFLADAPTQRLNVFALFILVQAYKLSQCFESSGEANSHNLLKWIAIDLLSVAIVATLRIPRLRFGWGGSMVIGASLIFVDWLLFGQVWVVASFLVPALVKSLFIRSISTRERSVRRSTVLGTEHLGGVHTVHLLPISTAQLNPSKRCYCRPTNSKSDKTLIPLIFNNTTPSRLSYSITTASASTVYDITINDLIPGSPKRDQLSLELDDWAPVPASPSPRHRSTSLAASDDLSPTQSLYFLPLSSIGTIKLLHVEDSDRRPVKLRQSRTDVIIAACPSAGFSTQGPTNRCQSAEPLSLDLAVSGHEPLSVRWHTTSSIRPGSVPSRLDGIIRGAEDLDSIIRLPVNVSLSDVGTQKFYLDSISDGCGNSVHYSTHSDQESFKGTSLEKTLAGMTDVRELIVHAPPQILFDGVCGKGHDVRLLRGKKSFIELKIDGVGNARLAKTSKFTAQLRFIPEKGGAESTTVAVSGWTKSIDVFGTTARVQVEHAGTYEILGVTSEFCDGIALVPNSCVVIYVPPPTLSPTFENLIDSCVSEIGVTSTLLLTGTPPFVVHYESTQLSPKVSTQRKSKIIQQSRDELKIVSSAPGDWEYRFVKLEDKYYKDVILPRSDDYARRQTVNRVSGAKWTESKKVVRSCEGEKVSVAVELKGSPPWEVVYRVVGSKPITLSGIKNELHSIDLKIPDSIAKRGGQFSLALESVQDANGCLRQITAPDLVVDVQRTKPTARFYGVEGKRTVVVRENEVARIPLRLMGEPPFAITYDTPRDSGVKLTASLPNVDIVIAHPTAGTYKLRSVKDKYCQGDVSETEWTVEVLPRPVLSLPKEMGVVARNGSVIRRGVCEGAVDSFQISLAGKSPFKITYDLFKSSTLSESTPHTLSSLQAKTTIPLYTATPGHHSYVFRGVGDSFYTTTPPPSSASSTSNVVRLEQDVFPLPEARFKSSRRLSSFCVNEPLLSRGPDDNLTIQLKGNPPFALTIEISDEGGKTREEIVIPNIKTHAYPLSLPSYVLSSPSTHTVTIRSITDHNSCSRTLDRSAPGSSTTFDVAEIATITAVEPRTDHCVGEELAFVCQGSPPFSVTYSFASRLDDGSHSPPERHTVALPSFTFSRLATNAGIFVIESVSHGTTRSNCSSNRIDLRKVVHGIPTVKMSTSTSGESYVEDIREGEQAEIRWDFVGEPPFTFTYVRSKPIDRHVDRTVLETHTVSAIEGHSHSIWTAQEGTWRVSYIKDAFCSYPASPATNPKKQLRIEL